MHNEELHNFYSSPNRMDKSRRMKCIGHIAWEGGDALRLLVGKPE
jgi:hypothetical protein